MSTSGYIQLEKAIAPFKSIMGKASDSIIDQEVTKYPIFVMHQHHMELGIPLVNEEDSSWRIQASSLEEFVSKQVIETNKIDSFRTIYKSPAKYFCLFVISDMGAKFVFIPR